MNQLLTKLVIFCVIEEKLQVYLHKSLLPSGLLVWEKSLDNAAIRLLEQKTQILLNNNYIEQLYTVAEKDGRKSVISVVYFILLPSHQIPKEKARSFVDCKKITKDVSDWRIIRYAMQRLRWKVEYTNVVYSLLPEEFTFSQLQKTYEAILGRVLDKRNFRKKISSLSILKDTGHIKKLGKTRPAEMYTFKERQLTFVEVL